MKINKKALLLGTMAFVLVAASGMVSAYASGSSGTKKAKVQTITEGVWNLQARFECHGFAFCGRQESNQ